MYFIIESLTHSLYDQCILSLSHWHIAYDQCTLSLSHWHIAYDQCILSLTHWHIAYDQCWVIFFIFFQQFPYPQYRSDTFLQIVDFIFPLFVVLSFIYSAGVFVKVKTHRTHIILSLGKSKQILMVIHHLVLQELVLEKETRIRETMKIMGLSNWVLWTTWFLKQLLFYLLPIIFMTILLKVRYICWYLLYTR